MINLDSALWGVGIAAETVLMFLLIRSRAYRKFPFFFSYCAWDVFSGVCMYLVVFRYMRESYPTFYLTQIVIDSVLEFCVIVELSWAVFRPMHNVLPRITPYALALLILLIGAAIWPFDSLASFAALQPTFRAISHVQQTTAIMRVLVFLALAGGSQFLSIGWRDRELQIATGLGFYSLVSLGVAMLQAHQTSFLQYAHTNQILIASYIASNLYWDFSFLQKEAARREFTPQMQNMLLAVAGVARANRAALSDSSITDAPRRRNR